MRIINRVKDELKKGHIIIIIIGFLYIVPNKESGRKISIVCAFLMSFIFFLLSFSMYFSYLVFSIWLEASDGEGGRVEWRLLFLLLL